MNCFSHSKVSLSCVWELHRCAGFSQNKFHIFKLNTEQRMKRYDFTSYYARKNVLSFAIFSVASCSLSTCFSFKILGCHPCSLGEAINLTSSKDKKCFSFSSNFSGVYLYLFYQTTQWMKKICKIKINNYYKRNVKNSLKLR